VSWAGQIAGAERSAAAVGSMSLVEHMSEHRLLKHQCQTALNTRADRQRWQIPVNRGDVASPGLHVNRMVGMPMQSVRAAVLLLAWIALALGSMAQGASADQGWSHLQQYWGQVQSISVDKCGQRPGLCEGTLVLTLRHGSKVSLAIRPGMWLKRGDRLVRLEELRVGDQIHVQAFEVARAGAGQAAQ
jgi:hypothetical protein